MSGLDYRGHVSMGEAAAGGAMIGMKFGGPLGAAIGAAAGFAAAGIRTLIGGDPPDKKLRKRIRELTGVDIDNKGMLKDMLAKVGGTSTFQMDAWIRSRDGQDMIELAAQMSGQRFRSKYNVPQLNLIGADGSVFEAAPWLNGQQMSQVSNLPSMGLTLDQISGGVGTSPTTVINFTMPADAVNDAFNGRTIQVIANNPRVVQGAALQAQRGSYGRTEAAVATTAPLDSRS